MTSPSTDGDQVVECLSSCIESIQLLKESTPSQNLVRHAELNLMAGMNTLFLRFHQEINGQAPIQPQEALATMLQSVAGITSNSGSSAGSTADSGNNGCGSSSIPFSSTTGPSACLAAQQVQEEKVDEEEGMGRKKRSRKSRSDTAKVGTKVFRCSCSFVI